MSVDLSEVQYDEPAMCSPDDLEYTEDILAECEPPRFEASAEIANTSRIGRWGGRGTYYQLGASRIRIFSGILEPPPTRLRKADYEQAARWGLNEVRTTEATAYRERIDFPARLNTHVVITGFVNLTTGRWGWATIFTRESGNASGAFLSYRERWRLRYGWERPSWTTGGDRKTVTLGYADRDGDGLAWYWRLS